ncbi:MAG TPA: phosphatase PAP2 family protein [Thermoleophilia bacterium]|nr:phosphatase PAP2 family protein [Thermoleophilia bacterium]HQG55268.1 phosphatase PAP2 family protein [Thermoleophilia bacterium]
MLTRGGDDRGPWPSSLHAAALAVVAAAFTVLGVLVALGAGGGLDWAIYEWIVSRRTPACKALFVAFTTLGSWYVIAPIALAAGTLFAMTRCRRQALLIMLAPTCALLLNIVLKVVFRRTPPGGDGLVAHARYSFPSGHTMAATAFAVALVFVAWPTRWRWPVTVGGVAAAAAMGFSRVYVGVHWPSDVIGGWMMGAATAWLVWLVLRPAR